MAMVDVRNDVKEAVGNVKANVKANIEAGYEHLKKKSMTIRLTLAVFGIVLTVMFAMVVFTTENIKKVVFANFLENASSIAEARTVQIETLFESYVSGLAKYTSADAVKTGDNQAVIDWFQEHTDLKDDDYEYVFFCGEDGTTYRDTGLVGSKGGILDRRYFQAIMLENRDSYIDNALISKTSGQWVVPVSRAAKNKRGKIFGFFTAMVNIEKFSEFMNSVSVGTSGYLFVVDADGNIICHKNPAKLYRTFSDEPEIERLIVSKKSGWIVTKPVGEKTSFVVTSVIESLGWTVGVVESREAVYAAGKSAQDVIFIFACVVVAVVAGLTAFMLRIIFRNVNTVTTLVEGVASGDADLTVRLPVNSNTEIGSIRIAVNRFIIKLQSIIANLKDTGGDLKDIGENLVMQIENTHSTINAITGNIKEVDSHIGSQIESVEGTASAVTEISKNIESLNKMIQDQAASVEEASSAVEEMIGNIKSVDSSVNMMAKQFSTLESETQVGIEKNGVVNQLVQTLAEESNTMMEANNVIQSIAEQTNLLAMNAAIEAAHAGEAGKGFSVVADEIRKLAETSAEQSQKIGVELTNMQNGISNAVKASGESEKTFFSVSSHIQATGDLVIHIRNAMQEQSEGSQQILFALKNMNSTTTEVRSASNEMEKGGQAILNEIMVLQSSTDEIKGAMKDINLGAKNVGSAADELETVSHQLKQSIKDIKDEIDLFKV